MKRLTSSTLRAVDARTGWPIELYGFEVLPNMSDRAPHSSYTAVRSPSPRSHPDGRSEISFRPGIDVVDVGAPGYEPQRFDPEAGNPPDGVFVVWLAQYSFNQQYDVYRINFHGPVSGLGLR